MSSFPSYYRTIFFHSTISLCFFKKKQKTDAVKPTCIWKDSDAMLQVRLVIFQSHGENPQFGAKASRANVLKARNN